MRQTSSSSNVRSMADAQSDSDEYQMDLAAPAARSAATILCDETDEESDASVPDIDPARPHLCKICKKGFTQVSARNVHQKTVHSSKKPWRCSECDKRFNQKSNAVTHQNIHSNNPKPWFCPVCKVHFSLKGNVVKHIRRTHGFEFQDIPKMTVSIPSILADNEQGDTHTVKTKHSTKRVKHKKIVQPAPPIKPPPGRIKTTPTSGQKRKRAPGPTPDPEEDSGIDLLIRKSPLTHKQKSNITLKPTNKKRKPSLSSSEHDSGFDEDFDSPTRRSSQSSISNDGAVQEYDFDFDGEEGMKVECE